MGNSCTEREVTVHPVGGMQLSEGYIRTNGAKRVVGNLPGLSPSIGDTVEDVLERLEKKAKVYYGDDVVVEIRT
jgi:hypothetical protein